MSVLGINAGFALAKRALGARLDPFPASNFLVEIDGVLAGGFTEVSGLSIQTVVQTKRFGGEPAEYTFVTGTKYTDLTLKRGITDLDLLWNWYNDVLKGKIKRKNGSIYMLDQMGAPVTWWDFYEAFPIKWSGPSFNATNNTVACETLVLSHNGLAKPAETQALSAARIAINTARTAMNMIR